MALVGAAGMAGVTRASSQATASTASDKFVDPKGGTHPLTEAGFTNALNEAQANGGGRISIGTATTDPTVITTSSGWDIPWGITIEGVNNRQRLPSFRRTADVPLFDFTGGTRNCVFRHLKLETVNSVATADPLIDGGGPTNNFSIRFRDCGFGAGGHDDGVSDAIALDNANDWDFFGCRFNADDRGFSGGWSVSNIRFIGNAFGEYLTGRAISLLSGRAYRIIGNTFGYVGTPIHIDGGADIGVGFNAYRETRGDSEVYINDWRTPKDVWVYDYLPKGIEGSKNGKRTVVNGVGYNDGDPAETGDWNGHGAAGVRVYDVSEERPYPAYGYVLGEWQPV